MEDYKPLYEMMLEAGELKIVFPRMTGEWEKDKKIFIQKQKDLESLL